MRTHRNGLLIALLLATASTAAFAADPVPAPAVAQPPPTMDDPGQPATAESIKPDDPRLAPLPAESAPMVEPAAKPVPKESLKSDGDPTNLPAMPTDDAFHPPPKPADTNQSADGYSVRSYTAANGDRIKEYRHGGQLSKVEVQPLHGKAFELDDTNGDGRIDKSDVTKNQVVPVQWKLFEWH